MSIRPAIALLLLAGCGSSPPAHEGTTTATIAGPVVASEGATNGPPAEIATAATSDAGTAAAPEGAGEIISVHPGFVPDPIVRRGSAGGVVPASTRSMDCAGYITDAPTFLLKVDAMVPGLRILVSTGGDAVLVAQLADGSVICNDDSEGLNPILDASFPPGRHRVWVGTYSELGSVGALPYTVAFTSSPSVTTYGLDSLAVTP